MITYMLKRISIGYYRSAEKGHYSEFRKRQNDEEDRTQKNVGMTISG